MKNFTLIFAVMMLLTTSCKQNSNKMTAIGVFELTEVVVSAENAGNILYFNAIEGQKLFKDSVIGAIDTTTLGLKKAELIIARDSTTNIRTTRVKRVSEIEKLISRQKADKIRLEHLLALNSATKKQIDDIDNSISSLEKELVSEQELLEKTNNEQIDDNISFEQQISAVEGQIRKCLISSPIDGTLFKRYLKVGDTTTIGKAIFSVINEENIVLKAYVTDQIQQQIYKDQNISVFVNGNEHNGVITWISEVREPTPQNIKAKSKVGDTSYAIKILLKNDGTLQQGAFGEAQLKGISISK